MKTTHDAASSKTPGNKDEEIRRVVLRVRELAGVSDEVFRGILGTTKRQYAEILLGKRPVDIASFYSLCDAFELNAVNVYEGRVDYKVLASRFREGHYALPDRYEVPAQKLSKMRSVHTIFRSLVGKTNSIYAKNIFSRFQVSPVLLGDPNEFISLHLITDVLSELRKEGFEDKAIRALGAAANEINRQTPLGEAFSKCKSPHDLYRAMHEELMDHFDRNWRYRILKLNESACTIEVTTREETLEAFQIKTVGTREGCLCRQGIYMSVLSHLENRTAQIKESECMYVDGDRCVYHLSW